MDSLHEDLIIKILLKLPVKSLLCFKSVCQQWHEIITSAYFVRNHFRESNRTSLLAYSGLNFCIGPHPYKHFNLFSLFHVETLERYEEVCPKELIGFISFIRGPCNDIFCVYYSNGTLALWNPATRKVRTVPRPPFPTTSELRKFCLGMDPVTDDIKIVLITPKQVAIYSLTDDSWRVREEESLGDSCKYLSDFSAPTLSNGFCYWIRFRSSTHIIVFDVHNELLQEIEIPESISESMTMKLIWYGDTLAVSTNYNIVGGKVRFEIWIFKEHGCWVKTITFSLPQSLDISFVAGVWKWNQILVVTHDQKLVIYDIDAGNTRTFEFPYIDENSHWSPINPFSVQGKPCLLVNVWSQIHERLSICCEWKSIRLKRDATRGI